MRILCREELASRHLLSAAYFPPPPRQPLAANQPTWVGEQFRAADFGRPDWGGGMAGSGWGSAPQSHDAGSAPVVEWIVITYQQPEHDAPVTADRSYPAEAASVITSNPKPPGTDAGSLTAPAAASTTAPT